MASMFYNNDLRWVFDDSNTSEVHLAQYHLACGKVFLKTQKVHL